MKSMNCLPQNNLEEHLARFAATKKTKSVVNNTGSSNRQFTFKRAQSLDQGKSTTSAFALRPVENWVSAPVKTSTASYAAPVPAELFKKPAPLSSVPKKQQTITKLFANSSQKKVTSVKSEQNSTKPVPPETDEFEDIFDDLSDFDLSSCRLGSAELEKPKKGGIQVNECVNTAAASVSDSERTSQSTATLDAVSRQNASTKTAACDIQDDGVTNFINSTSILDVNDVECIPKELLNDDDEEEEEDGDLIRSIKKKNKKVLVISDDEEEEEIRDNALTSPAEEKDAERSPSPETQILDCCPEDDFVPADMFLRNSACSGSSVKAVKPAISNSWESASKSNSHSLLPQKNHHKKSSLEVCKNSADSCEVFNYKTSPLLRKNHFKDEKIDMLHSILASLDEMNLSVMAKICSEVEKDKQILEKNQNINSLTEIRRKILSQYEAAEKAIASRSSLQKTDFSSVQRDFGLLRNNPSLQRMQSTPIFGHSTQKSWGKIDCDSSLFADSYSGKICNSRTGGEAETEGKIYNSRTVGEVETKVSSQPEALLSGDCEDLCETPDILDETDLDFCDDNAFGEIPSEIDDTMLNDVCVQERDQLLDISCDKSLMNDLKIEGNPEDITVARDIYGKKTPEKTFPKSGPSSDKGVAGKFYGNYRDDGASEQFKGTSFPHSAEMLRVFREVFGLRQFRYNQLEAINAALLNEDCFVLMPTGGGKSLCYQLPALISNGVTIVVSPLRSLIMDQVQKLWSLDVPANSLSGEVDGSSVNSVYKQLASRDPSIKLLYVTPEKISASNKLMSTLESLYKRHMLARFVIDEAHCVSEWGHDFRPDYKRLKVLREKFPGVAMIALTATATPRVRLDILQQLNMKSPKWFLQSFNRPNLKYEVRHKRGKGCFQDIYDLLTTKFKNMSGIVYCLSRNDCDNCASFLNDRGVKAVSYHAGLDNRNEVQELWFNDKFKVVCATIAFGMGIDKPDVRFVIHHTIPKSIECYYQESGRAGRDGELSWCILFYSYQDMARIKRIIQMDESNRRTWGTHFNNLFRMVHYCENKTDCRRVQMLEYFGEVFDKKLCSKNPKAACDNCFSKEAFENCDVTEDAKAIVQCVTNLVGGQRGRKNYPLTYFIDIFKGSKTQKILAAGHDKLPLHGRGNKYVRSDAERLLRKLVLDQFLQENLVINQMDLLNSYVYPGRKASDLLEGRAKVIFSMKKDKKSYNSLQSVTEVEDVEMKELSDRCYNELIEVSKAIATEHHMHYTNVINVEALRQMSREMPVTEEAMLRIPHVTRTLFDKYGARFLEITERYGAERCVIEAERADKQMMSVFLDNAEAEEDDNSWMHQLPSIGRAYGKASGIKRKKNGGTMPPAKRKGKFFAAKNSAWKKKKKAKATKMKGANSRTNSINRSSTPPAAARAPGFLPVPKPQPQAKGGNKRFSRPFLSSVV